MIQQLEEREVEELDEVEKAKEALGRCLNGLEGCLKVMKILVTRIVNSYNPVWIATEQEFLHLIKGKRGKRFSEFREEYKLFKERVDEYNYTRVPEDFVGEYTWAWRKSEVNLSGPDGGEDSLVGSLISEGDYDEN